MSQIDSRALKKKLRKPVTSKKNEVARTCRTNDNSVSKSLTGGIEV